jgi:hypothetical protein
MRFLALICYKFEGILKNIAKNIYNELRQKARSRQTSLCFRKPSKDLKLYERIPISFSTAISAIDRHR